MTITPKPEVELETTAEERATLRRAAGTPGVRISPVMVRTVLRDFDRQQARIDADAATIASLRDELKHRETEWVKWVAAEHELSAAYLRLRKIIGDEAFKTPHAPTPEQVWATTEAALANLRERVGELEREYLNSSFVDWRARAVAAESSLATARQDGFEECREKAAQLVEADATENDDGWITKLNRPRYIEGHEIATALRTLTPGGDNGR